MAVWPICLGYVPLGLAFGILAEKAGLRPFEIGLMSLIVFAGSSQFIAVSMLDSGATAVSIVATTLVVNLRHFLMSSALAVYLGRVGRGVLSLFAYGVTDESFALNLARFRDGSWGTRPGLVVNHTANLTWIASTMVGGFSGQFIPAGAFGIDYALTAMFICLLVFQLRGRKYVIAALVAGVVAVALALALPGNSYIVLAAVITATLGIMFNKWLRRVSRD
jgi:4-azaleucine resistance transporter AzlC